MEDKKIEDNGDRDVVDLDLDELRYKHIILRNLQKTAILEIDKLEIKNVDLTDELIELRKSVVALTENNAVNQKLMIGALTNNNAMKEDYRSRIQTLEKELSEYKK